MKNLEQRRKDALGTAKKYEKRGRHFKAAEFLTKAAFLSDDDDAYAAWMQKARILESIGFNPVNSLNAAYNCALSSAEPNFTGSLNALYELAGYYGRLDQHDVAKAVLREAAEIIFIFETQYGWDSESVEYARLRTSEMMDSHSELFKLQGSPELIRRRQIAIEDTLNPGEILINAQPELGIA